MGTEAEAALILAQWFSPAYPVGGFAYSHGVEQAIGDGQVTDGATLAEWVADVLERGTGRNDAILIRLAAASDDPGVAEFARAAAPTAERRLEAELQGAAFARTTAAVWTLDLPPLPYPVAIGRAARLLRLDPERVARHHLLAFAGAMVSVAVRLVPLGQTDGQRVLAGLAGLCARIAADTEGLGVDGIGGLGLLSDIASMRHEAREIRVFRT